MNSLDAGVIVLYLVISLGGGVWLSRRASESLDSYFLGGRRIPWLGLAASGAVSNFDVTGTMWMVSVLYLLGMKSWWHHWMWGVMLPAFGLAYMAKWVRRSGVITGAEWMQTRFGDGADGRAARFTYALMAVITCASFIGYAFQGIGKFAMVYIPLESLAPHLPFAQELLTAHKAQTLAVIVFIVTTAYVILGGLYGVVITDVIQTVVLTLAALVIVGIAFVKVPADTISHALPAGWSSLTPVWRIPEFAGTQNAGYEMFGLLTLAWFIKGLFLNAGGPGQMYDFQRYLAARSPSDAAKVAAAWPLFLIVRWAMVAAIVVLAYAGVTDATDPELVMPQVLHLYLPAGLRGLVIAGLLAAFMSTFSSTANSGASYVVRDLWQPLIGRGADEAKLVRGGWLATAGIVLAGAAIGWNADSITTIWGWIMMALGGGVIVPNLLRWHWWRMNGWGYAAGVMGGILLSLIPLFFPDLPVYVVFPVISAGSFIASVIVSVLTPPTEEKILADFHASVRPFGFWGPVKKSDGKEKEGAGKIIFNTAAAVIGITGLYLAPMYAVTRFWAQASAWTFAAAAAAVVLYFTWYRELSKDKE